MEADYPVFGHLSNVFIDNARQQKVADCFRHPRFELFLARHSLIP
jgi:hypothetical protein